MAINFTMTFSQRNNILKYYFLFSYLIILIICSIYLKNISISGAKATTYLTATYLSYSFIYLLPALLVTQCVSRLQYWLEKDAPSLMEFLVYAVAIISTAMTDLALMGDCTVYNIYNFHLNNVGWNLIITPDGSKSVYAVLITIFFGAISLQAILLWTIVLFHRWRLPDQLLKSTKQTII